MSKQAASERFNKIASNFVTSEVHANSPTIQKLHGLLDLPANATVCDVACGAGHLALSFGGKASRIVGVDPAPNMLSAFQGLAESKGIRVEAFRSGAENLPFEDGSFDLVMSRLAPHHFRDIQKAVREMARIAKKGGYVAVIDLEGHPDPGIDEFNHRLEVLHDPTHGRSYTASHWRELFERAGLRILTLENELSEKPGGVPIRRWCEIASSGAEAELEIRRLVREAPPRVREELGITQNGDEFHMPVRTVLILAQKP
ncbi:MAG TPA: methyltransferase domain-containing protein [Nitrospira sp.]|nr:methyltransferase domain-containing protein [Nitrospira sp.]